MTVPDAALTVCQPFAELIARGDKPIENRKWFADYRGPVAIHAGKSRGWLEPGDESAYPGMAFGAIVAVASLVACLPRAYTMSPSAATVNWGRWAHLVNHEHAEGPWCWVLEDVRRLASPIPCGGALGLWRIPALVTVQLQAQAKEAVR